MLFPAISICTQDKEVLYRTVQSYLGLLELLD